MRSRDDRHLRLGSRLANLDEAETARKFEGARVAIAWSTDVAIVAPEMVLLAANLIVRFCRRIHLATEGPLAEQTLDLLAAIDSSAVAEFTQGTTIPRDITASLHLGGGVPPGLPNLTTAAAEGWIAHVSSEGDVLPVLDGFVPFGYLAAAAFGTCEVFKRLLPPLPGRGRLFPLTSFSTFNYSAADPEQGPPLPSEISVLGRPVLGGAGAVGQAFLHALRTITGLCGELAVVDRDIVDDANLNRYVLAVESDAAEGLDKTAIVYREFEGHSLEIIPEQRDLAEVVADINNGNLPRPNVVISALDDYEPRRLLQNLWSDLVLEGATGDTLLQVFRHAHREGLACLRCIHTEPVGRRYEDVLSEASGLSADRITRAFSGEQPLLEETDLQAMPAKVRERLHEAVGRDMCGLLQELAGFDVSSVRPVEPAVSFTSYLAGLLVASEFIRATSDIPCGLAGRYQLDPIATLAPGHPWAETKRTDCYCVERSEVIEAYRRRAATSRANDHV